MAELHGKYTCTYCQDEIQGIRVHCVDCKDDFELCLQCFSAGAEIGPHKNDHSYQLTESALSVFHGRGAWSAKEERHLLDAIEKFGFGNWEDISKHIETKTSEEAKDEYISRFLSGSIGRHTWGVTSSNKASLVEAVPEDTGPLSPSTMQHLPPLDITPDEASQLGYMPNRDDFEREYDHEAEQLVSLLALSSDDDNLEIAVKLSLVDWYTRRLRERARRKRMVRDYQLVAQYFRGNAKKAKQTKEQRELVEQLKPFCQFLTANEHEQLLNSLERERALRFRFAELARYRMNGLSTVDECRHFEQHVAALNKSSTSSFKVETPDSSGTTAELQQMEDPENEGSPSDSSSTDQRFMSSESSYSNLGSELLSENELEGRPGNAYIENGSRFCTGCESPLERGNDFTLVSKDAIFVQTCAKSGSIFDICVAWSVLYKLCKKLNLEPFQYLTTKTYILGL